MRTSQEINEIAKAMSAAQGQIQPASKDSVNPHFRSKFSSLAAVWDVIRQPLKDNGLTVWQDVSNHEKGVSVETKIVHTSGQWVEFGPLIMPVAKIDAQSIGSAISYSKRYSLSAAFGVVSSDEDDDANNAMPKQEVYQPENQGLISHAQLKYLCSLIDKDTQDKMLTFYKIDDLSKLTSVQAKVCIDKAKAGK